MKKWLLVLILVVSVQASDITKCWNTDMEFWDLFQWLPKVTDTANAMSLGGRYLEVYQASPTVWGCKFAKE